MEILWRPGVVWGVGGGIRMYPVWATRKYEMGKESAGERWKGQQRLGDNVLFTLLVFKVFKNN